MQFGVIPNVAPVFFALEIIIVKYVAVCNLLQLDLNAIQHTLKSLPVSILRPLQQAFITWQMRNRFDHGDGSSSGGGSLANHFSSTVRSQGSEELDTGDDAGEHDEDDDDLDVKRSRASRQHRGPHQWADSGPVLNDVTSASEISTQSHSTTTADASTAAVPEKKAVSHTASSQDGQEAVQPSQQDPA
jgi:hypothetical protein